MRKPISTAESEGVAGAAATSHGGGQRWPKGSPEYETILKWIERPAMTAEPARASVRFYAELNDHLAPHQRYLTLEKTFFVPPSVKEVIESFGIPHTEVEVILINGESSDFSRPGARRRSVALYPSSNPWT